MITQYFDINQRLIIQAPGTLAPASLQPWVYADNYNLAIYLVSQGNIQPIGSTDSLALMLFQPVPTLPEQNLAIISAPVIKTDVAGQNYYQVNVNLGTVPLANLVQTPNAPAKCQFHYIFNPATGERFSSSADIPVTVNPDPTKDATGATPVPPSYPTNPNVFELIAHKGTVNGYAGLDATGKVPVAQLPASTAGGDMLKSVYDTDGNGVVDTCDSVQSSRVIGLGTAAAQNIPASGNASTSQVVYGNDTRLTDSRTPVPHQATHVGGSDPIPLASTSASGLCPPPDGTTIQVVSGKLTATTTGNGDMLKSVYDTNNDGIVDNAAALQTHVIPTTGNATATQIVLGSDTRLSDSRNPLAHESTHLVGGADPIALASAAAAGLCPAVDNTTIQVSTGKLAAILATASAPGIVKPDGSTIAIAGGVISIVGSPGIGAHGSRVRALSTSTIIATGTLTKLTFDAAAFDTDAYHSGATFDHLTIPTGQAGYYIIIGSLQFPNTAGGTFRGIAVNSSSAGIIGQCYLPFVSAYAGLTINVSSMWQLPAGDQVSLQVLHDVGANLTHNSSNSFFAMFRIG